MKFNKKGINLIVQWNENSSRKIGKIV
jgi:hypothetical protein